MKRLLFVITLLTTSFLSAQKPEKVYSITKEQKEISWYETQQCLWKEITDKNSRDGNAWMNYYAATRAMKNLSSGETREKYRRQSDEIVTAVSKAMPKSFEAYFLSYSESGLLNGAADLMKAQALRPDDLQMLDELMIHYELAGDAENQRKYAVKMFEANELASGFLNWGYNLLAELDENAILFTAGDNDTYAIWIIQAAKGFRQDVKVVNTSLILMDDYRDQLLKQYGYDPLDMKYNGSESTEEHNAKSKMVTEHFFKGKRPVYVATSAAGLFTENVGSNLFLTGLAYKYSASSFDNVSIIKRNYEKRYLLDYLTGQFSYNIGDHQARDFNGMYLPSMIRLYQLYDMSEDLVQKTRIEDLMIRVAEQSGQQSEVLEIIGKR